MSAARVRLYQERKAAGLCVSCAAGLTEDDGLQCVECTELHRAWAASPAGRASNRKANKAYLRTPHGREANRRKTERMRKRHIKAGLCIECTAKATRGQRCEKHGAAHVERNKRRQRPKAGL